MLGLDYIAKVESAVDHVHGQVSVLAQAAEAVVDSALSKGRLFVHDSAGVISYEATGRAAGLYTARQLRVADLQRADIAPQDVVVFFSSRSYVEGDQVFLKQISERGATIIAAFPVSQPTGGRVAIADYSDLVIDNGVQDNQGTLTLPGFSEKLGPIDVVVNCVILWALCAEIIGEFLRRGLTPSVYMTIRAQGSDDYNSKVWAQYQRQGF
jgi:uncharacterized phosphosugar-binding protein